MLSKELIKAFNKTRNVSDKSLICHAPFVSLNFEQNGNVTACCYNRNFVLGKYPDQKLMEIWQGEKLQQLRSWIASEDLSGGCQICASQIKSENFYGVRARHFDHFSERPTEELFPKVMEFEMSNTCNLQCAMCNGYYSSSIRQHRENLPVQTDPYDHEFVKQFIEFIPHLVKTKYLGGEPLMIKTYLDMWEQIYLLNPAIEIEINTNATLLSTKVKDLMEKLNMQFTVSIDSIRKETYEKIRKGAQFEKVWENIEYLKQLSDKREKQLTFTVCPITWNWEEIPEIIQYGNEHQIMVYFNTVVDPPVLSLKFLDAASLGKIVDYYESFSFGTNNHVNQYNADNFNGLINQLKAWKNEAIYDTPGEKQIDSNAWQQQKAKMLNNGLKVAEERMLGNVIDSLSWSEELIFINKEDINELGIEEMAGLYLLSFGQAYFLRFQDDTLIEKTKELKSRIFSHSRKMEIIDHILATNPVALMSTLRQLDARQIWQNIETRYE